MKKKWIPTVVLVAVASLMFYAKSSDSKMDSGQAMSSKKSLERLIQGNERFMAGNPLYPNQEFERRKETVEKQTPFAIVVSCSDSRVPTEIIFDQGIGDIFVVRVAGNVVGPIELDSIEYAADILKSPLIVVLGHQNCGAVKAILEMEKTGVYSEDIQNIVPFIQPAIQESKGKAGDPLANAITANINNVVNYLNETEILAKLVRENKLEIVGGYYTLEKGKIEIFK